MDDKTTKMIDWADFEKLEIRVGTIIQADEFPEARKPAYRLRIDFGNGDVKQSSAQITDLYKASQLIGKQVVAVVNFPVKRIAGFKSECLVLAAVDKNKQAILLQTERQTENGLRIL